MAASSTTKSHCRRFEGKLAVVTASTLGIGFAIAQRLGEEGAHVVISSRKQAHVDEALAKLRALGCSVSGMVCHVGKAEDRAALVAHATTGLGRTRIDVLVSNAAVQPAAGPTLAAADAIFDKIFDVNVKAAWQVTKAARPFLGEGSSIVYVSSVGGYNPGPPLGLYGVSKTALLGLSKLLAKELGPAGIRVNCLAPGVVRTRFSKVLWESEAANAAACEAAFLGRTSAPEEMAGAVAFMCCEDASFMTGETMIVGGGLEARL